jgi:NADPH-dependent glutamate synthase beta subunit-like oxidoreductase
MGCSAHVYDRAAKPGGKLIQVYSPEELPLAAVERDLKGVLLPNIHFIGGREFGSTLELQELLRSYDAVYLAMGLTDALSAYLASVLGHDWLQGVDRRTQQVAGRPGVYAGGDLVQHGQTVVEAAAAGRSAAVTIGHYLAELRGGRASRVPCGR